MATSTEQTSATIQHHLGAFAKGVDEILKDFSEDSVIFTPKGPVCGLEGVRQFFTEFAGSLPPDFLERFKLDRTDVEGEVGYITWSAEPHIPVGTDTFIVRNGKIAVQTFAAYQPTETKG